ncbi:MAG: hypothetical protein ACXACP_06255 [Candidatus Hodarchaeales archaeon]
MIDLGSELFSLLLALVGMTSFVLGFYILIHHPRHPNNRSFFIFAMLGSYWAIISFVRTLTTNLHDRICQTSTVINGRERKNHFRFQ